MNVPEVLYVLRSAALGKPQHRLGPGSARRVAEWRPDAIREVAGAITVSDPDEGDAARAASKTLSTHDTTSAPSVALAKAEI